MKVSIITVVLNDVGFIESAIQSVLSQTYKNIEYIVMDGLSTDGTLAIINKYKSQISKIVSEKDDGLFDAMRKGVEHATGDIIGMLNADDFLADEDVIINIVDAFNKYKVECIYGDLLYVDRYDLTKNIRLFKSSDYEDGIFIKSWVPPHLTFYCKKELFDKFGNYKTNYKLASDMELMFRFLEINKCSSKYIEKTLVIMRHEGASTRGIRSTLNIIREVRQAFKENNRSFNIIKYLLYKLLKTRQLIFK